MKRIYSVLVIASVAALFACGGSANNNGSADSAAADTAKKVEVPATTTVDTAKMSMDTTKKAEAAPEVAK